MDRFIAEFFAVPDDDLMLCPTHGVAYQRDMSHRVRVPYFDVYQTYDSEAERAIERRINTGRRDLVNKYAGSYTEVLDVGVGCGAFIKCRPFTYGFDLDPKAVAWLQDSGRYTANFRGFKAFTFWDVIEHIETPDEYFSQIGSGSHLFCCLPIFSDLRRIRDSKHYRPGEHLYYWTEAGFVGWMGLYGFRLLERQDVETRAGRDSILSFAFLRD